MAECSESAIMSLQIQACLMTPGKLARLAVLYLYCGAWWLIGRFVAFRSTWRGTIEVAWMNEFPNKIICSSSALSAYVSGAYISVTNVFTFILTGTWSRERTDPPHSVPLGSFIERRHIYSQNEWMTEKEMTPIHNFHISLTFLDSDLTMERTK